MRKSAIYVILASLLAVGCNKVVMEPARMGTISLALSSNVEVVADTKAEADECSDFLVTISGTTLAGTLWEADYVYGNMPEEVAVPYGSYVVAAESCSEAYSETSNEGFGCVRYYGETPVDIVSKTPESVSLTCRMVNGKATLFFDDSFLEDFTDITAMLSCNGREVEFAVSEAGDVYFNVEDQGSDLVYTIYATVAEGTDSERRVSYSNSSKPLELKPAKWAKITLKSNHNGLIGPDITVDDTMGDNLLPELVDPNGGQEKPKGEMDLPSITVDTQIEDATVIDCYLDIQ
jgi:hypothetical protein